MYRLPRGISIDFLGTIARFQDGKSVGGVYRDFMQFLSPSESRETELNIALFDALRRLSAENIDSSFRDNFKRISAQCASPGRLALQVPDFDRGASTLDDSTGNSSNTLMKTMYISVPGGVTHEETEEFWLHLVKSTFVQCLELNTDAAGGASNKALIRNMEEDDCFTEEFFYPLYEYFGSAVPYESPAPVIECLEWLRNLRCCTDSSRQLRLALVTNNDARVKEIVKGLQLDKYFDEIISSHESKVLKPNPKAIQMAASSVIDGDNEEEIILKMKQWIHIGDDEADRIAAEKAGCLFLDTKKSGEKEEEQQEQDQERRELSSHKKQEEGRKNELVHIPSASLTKTSSSTTTTAITVKRYPRNLSLDPFSVISGGFDAKAASKGLLTIPKMKSFLDQHFSSQEYSKEFLIGISEGGRDGGKPLQLH